MPIYEYRCNKCGNTFEQLIFPSDGEDQFTCTSCGDEDTCRVLSSFSCVSSSYSGGDMCSEMPSTGCPAPSGGCPSSSGGFS